MCELPALMIASDRDGSVGGCVIAQAGHNTDTNLNGCSGGLTFSGVCKSTNGFEQPSDLRDRTTIDNT